MLRRGGIVLIPFPFSDLTATKKRPVLVLTKPDSYGDFIALPVTSRPQTDHGIAITQADLIEGQLPLISWIRTDRVVTLSATLVLKAFGRVSETLIETALAHLCDFVGHHGAQDPLS